MRSQVNRESVRDSVVKCKKSVSSIKVLILGSRSFGEDL